MSALFPQGFQAPHSQEALYDAKTAKQDLMSMQADNQRALEDFLNTSQAPVQTVPVTARGVSAFAPGILTPARTLQVAKITNPFLIEVDVFLGTAGVGTTAGSCANIVVSGAAAGSVTLPLTPDGKEFHLTTASLANFLCQQTVVSAATDPQKGNILNQGFQLTSNGTAVGVTIDKLQVETNGAGLATGGLLVGLASSSPILDSVMPTWLTDVNGNNATVLIPAASIPAASPAGYTQYLFAASVTLTAGQSVWICMVNVTSGLAVTPAYNGSVLTGFGVNYGNAFAADSASGATSLGTWRSSALSHSLTFANTGGSAIPNKFGIIGAAGGTALGGDVTISTTLTGTPATPGNDANILVQM